MTNSFRIIAILLLFFVAAKLAAQTLQVSGAPANNAKILSLIDLPPFDPPGDSRSRFQAFWIPGDGNYIQFDASLDAVSMTPQNYIYPAAPANYTASAYLTGKYTNRKPPARAANSVNIPGMSTAPPSGQFRTRLNGNTNYVVDIFSNHEIQKKYLTTFVISWPANVQASGIYFFYNGYKNSATGEFLALSDRALSYSNTEIPAYFTSNLFNASKIREYTVEQMTDSGAVDGLTFSDDFTANVKDQFSFFAYFPSEEASSREMPEGYTENRLFPVLWADSTFTPLDTFMNFLVVLTDSVPISTNPSDALYQQLRNQMETLFHSDLMPDDIFARTVGSQLPPQYIVAVADYQLEYLSTFDPNQLTVDNIEKLGDDDYRVTFRLEMCNKGKGIVERQNVALTHNTDFREFTPADFQAFNSVVRGGSWQFESRRTIVGAQEKNGHNVASCEAIKFTARTNCRGIRGLWKGRLDPAVVRTCVTFSGSLSDLPECHGVTPIDSTRFHADGECFCCLGPMPPSNTEPTDPSCWPWWVWGLLVLLLYIIWRIYKHFNP